MITVEVDRMFEGEKIIALDFQELTLITTVTMKTLSGKECKMLIATAPDWVRDEWRKISNERS